MRVRTRLCSLLLVAAVGLTLASCGKSGQPKETAGTPTPMTALYFPERNENNGTFLAEMVPECMSGSVAEMFQKADTVIVASVLRDDEQWISEPSGLENACSTVAVEEVWKGNVAVGDEITVYETGWRYDDHDLSVGGEPILRKNMRVVLFLTAEANGERCVCGSYQGKLYLDESNTAHPYSCFASGQEGYPSFSDVHAPMAMDDLKTLLNV